jgi:hypothetical protein
MRNAKQLQVKSRKHEVEQVAPAGFTVKSGGSGKEYRVILGTVPTCTCDWGQYRKVGSPCACSHVLAVYDFLGSQVDRKLSAWASEEEAKRQKRQTLNVGDGVYVTFRKAAPILVSDWPTQILVEQESVEI